MPSNDEQWLDAEAGPVVRPYALTQGRTGSYVSSEFGKESWRDGGL
jgi:hypothetical protein